MPRELISGDAQVPALPLLRAGFEASGSGRWLMRCIVDRGLDQANGFRLQIELAGDQVRAGLQATEACLAAATADVVDTDWLSIARCRRSGIALAAAVPYGAIFGGLVTRRGSVPALSELPGRRIGVVHADDKNWLLLRAACRALHGFDPEAACTRVDAGSKTTLRQQLADGSVDAALLYWHQIPALVASGDFVEVCDLLDLLPLLGVRTVPSTFFVFSDALLDAQPDLVRGFARAVSAAVRILRDDAAAWHAVTGTVAEETGGHELRAKWLARIPLDWDSAMRTDLLRLAHCMGENELPDGVFAAGFL
jgi:NitT/TauT family transport system substrate-binding protein